MKGRPPGSLKRFNINYQSLSEITGLSRNSLIKYASMGKFKPNDLLSLLEFVSKYRKLKNK